MGSLIGGKKKAPPPPAPVVEEPAAPIRATRREKLEASRTRSRRGGYRSLMSASRLGPQAEGEPVKTTLGAG